MKTTEESTDMIWADIFPLGKNFGTLFSCQRDSYVLG
jgi:hypothetical protein